MMRSTAIGLAATLLLVLASSVALARGGHMGGHMSGGHMSGGHWGGGHWGGHVHSGGVRHFAAFHGARFHHHRRFFVGYPGFYGYAAYGGCWQWRPTYWGWRRVWVCGYPYSGYF
jgi:hypothetical protein